jgi:hypothetical protein
MKPFSLGGPGCDRILPNTCILQNDSMFKAPLTFLNWNRAIATAILCTVLAAPAACLATLIVVIPTKDGVIIASDSRGVLAPGFHCDEIVKILILKRHDRAALAVTATTRIGGPAALPYTACEYHAKYPALFDIKAVMKEEIEKLPSPMTRAGLLSAGESFRLRLKTFVASNRERFSKYVNQKLSTVLFVQYNPATQAAVIAAFTVVLKDYEPSIAGVTWDETTTGGSQVAYAFGEITKDFLDRLDNRSSFKRLIHTSKTVAGLSKTDGAAAAADLIQRVKRINDKVGGPVRIVLLGARPKPERLR